MPLNLFLILAALALVFLLIRWYRTSAVTGIFAFIIIMVSITPVIPNMIISNLEGQFPVLHDPSSLFAGKNPEQVPHIDLETDPESHLITENGEPDSNDSLHPDQVIIEEGQEVHIMVLGGGHSPDPWLPATTRLSPRALSRLTEGIRLHRKLPGSRLILSGWSSSGGESVAEVMALAAIELGVDSTHIRVLPEPSNTCREAQAYHRRFGRSHPLILVTSATHMPRAMQLFRQNGLTPIAAPTGHRIKFHPDRRYFYMKIDASNINKLEAGIRAKAGSIWGRYQCVPESGGIPLELP